MSVRPPWARAAQIKLSTWIPLSLAACAVAAGVIILAALGAPRQLIALVIAMLVGPAVTGAITTRWKISLHTAVATGTTTILTVVIGSVLLATAILVGAIAWSRAHRDHTPLQVIAGAIIGSIVAAVIFLPLR